VTNAGALYNAGVTSVVEILQGTGHVPVNDQFGPTIFSQSANFVYFMLDLAHAAGQPPQNAAATDAMAGQLRSHAIR
jgi:hypothetical protein